jgi:hypothetical protein
VRGQEPVKVRALDAEREQVLVPVLEPVKAKALDAEREQVLVPVLEPVKALGFE